MDIKTEKGQRTLEQEREAIEIWRAHYPSVIYNETPKGKPAIVDAVLTTGKGEICGIVETKCRVSMDLEEFDSRYNWKWLITFEKVMNAVDVAKALQVPFVGFLYFPRDKTLLVQKIFSPDTGFCTVMEIRHTTTQATVNGGKIDRDNAYIDMSSAKKLSHD